VNAKLCRKRALKRWSALLTQTKSRIGYNGGMRMRLGEAHWKAFVRYAEVEFKETFARALMPMSGVLCCAGKIDGSPCPKQLQIDLKTVSHTMLAERLPGLHMDHTHDVKRICDVWSHALPKEPQSWDDGICGPLLAHLLFGTEDHVLTQCSERPIWRKQIEVRCGNVRGVKEQHSEDFCHDVANTHTCFGWKTSRGQPSRTPPRRRSTASRAAAPQSGKSGKSEWERIGLGGVNGRGLG